MQARPFPMTSLLVALAGTALVFSSALCHAQQPALERPERIDTANEQPAKAAAPAFDHSWRALPGVQPSGEVLLPNQWSLKPTGLQLELGDFPVNIAMHPGGVYCAIVHSGQSAHELIIVNTKSKRIESRIMLAQTFYGATFDSKGERLFVSGGEEDVVHSYRFVEGLLSDHVAIKIVDPKEKFVTTGVSLTRDDSTLIVCGSWGDKVALVPLNDPTKIKLTEFPDGTFPYAAIQEASQDHGTIGRIFVSLWGGSAVAVLDGATGAVTQKWETRSHPTEMVLSPDGQTLYVSCANSTMVTAIDTATGKTREVINCALYPTAPSGNTPSSLALSADGTILAVANADNNNLAIFNVESQGQARSMGFVPTGWYPTSVRFQSNGAIVYTSGKGMTPKSNRHGPNPLVNPPGGIREYIGGLFRGTLGFVPPLTPESLVASTKSAYEASPLAKDASPNTKRREANNPIPAKIGDPSPITHCIYIIKENRTYDQVFGDMPEGNGDPSLCIFPEHVTPNLHALAREFVLLDNFYVESEVSADGHEWSMGAYATDFVEKTWPLTYRGFRPAERELAYPAEGSFDIAIPAGGYIWDRCREAGVSYRSYGEWVENGKTPNDPCTAKVPALEGHFDPMFRSYDLDYPDVKRAERFLSELKRFEQEGDMPRLSIVRIPNDHTSGTRRGKPTPTAMVADNDLAVGMVIEGLSRSKFWPTTAVFIIEDDAQNGSDHVDAHRTTALVISPYCKRNFLDSSMYSTASMLRTMELILGLQPMSQFDAAALPMYNSFQAKPDLTPYTKRPANVNLDEKNLATAWGADLSETFDLAKEDAADDLLLNEVVWRSVRGPDSPMPAPVRAAFVFQEVEDEESDENSEVKPNPR